MKRLLVPALLLATPSFASAETVTYSQHIRPLWEARCATCHGSDSAHAGEWRLRKEEYKRQLKGPRMDSYAALLHFVGWPQSGALMRQLDDGRQTPNGKPGGMYRHLGDSEAERQENLQLFKAWVGEEAWTLKHWQPKKGQAALSREELARMQLAY